MRYFYEKPKMYRSSYGTTYECNHPVYNKCTLFEIGDKGLAVIQQRYCMKTKYTYWTEIDPWLTGELYLHLKFKSFFDERARESDCGIYPTVTVRQIMWALKNKANIARTMGNLFRSTRDIIR